MTLAEMMYTLNVILRIELRGKPQRTAQHRAPPETNIGRVQESEMTGHVNPYRPRTLRAAGIVDAFPLLEDGVEFLPIVPSLETERLGEGCGAQGLLQLGLRYPVCHVPRRSERERLTWCLKSTRTAPPAGGRRQSGTITSMNSLVGPCETPTSPTPPSRRYRENACSRTGDQRLHRHLRGRMHSCEYHHRQRLPYKIPYADLQVE